MKRSTLAFAGAALVIVVLSQSVYILPEGKQALVVRFGKPVEATAEPGLKFKAPFIDTLITYESRLLAFDFPTEQVILGDQKRMEIETFARFRIADPLRFQQSVRSVDLARTQIGQIVGSAFRRAMGQIELHALLTDERDRLIDDVTKDVMARCKAFGVEVVEVHMRRADLPMETSQAIYERMRSEREREAKELRAQGFEQAQQIKSRAEKERTVLLSEAEKASRIARGAAEAQASETLAQAYEPDPKFYRFYRALQSYKKPYAEAAPTIILSPDAEMLETLKSGPKLDAAKPEAAR